MRKLEPTLNDKLDAAYFEIQDKFGLSGMNRAQRRTPRGKLLTLQAKIAYLERENEILREHVELQY
jgi:hypothetical protein